MKVAAAVGAERLAEIITKLMTCCVAIVQLYGGTVEKLTGDGSWWCLARRSRWRMALFARTWPWRTLTVPYTR
jgi:class 3 adenylate cyclase